MSNQIQHIDRLLKRIWIKHERARWQYGVLGRTNSDGTVTVDAPRQDYVYVTMDTGTLTQAYNKGSGAVPSRAGLPVKVRDDAGRLIIDGENTSGLLEGDANAPSKVYSVNLIGPDSHGNVTLDPDDLDDTATTHKFTTAAEITKLAGIEALADVTDAGNIASSITGVATDDTIIDADIWGYLTGGVLVKTAWSNIKAVLKTYFDTIYTFAAIVADNSITNAKLRDSGALSVIGRSANSSGDPADISASAASDAVLRESGSALGFGTIATGGIAADAVTFAKMQNIATDSLVGRDTAGTGDPENILLGASLSMDGSGNLQRAALTGDVTAAANGNATSIASNAVTTAKIADANVTLAKLANIATDSLIGRDTASSGVPENILLNATLSMDGSGNLQRAALSGDISASAGSNTTAIGANKVLTAMINDAQVTLAKMANLAADTIIGRANGAGTGVPTALSAAQVATIIQASIDHGSIAGLGDDDHSQYALLAGRSGGQTLSGGTANTDDFTINSSSNGSPTSASVVFIQTGSASRTMVGSSSAPIALLHTHRTTNGGRNTYLITNDGTGDAQAGFRAGIDPTDDTTNYVSMDVFGSGRSTVGLIEALGTIIEGNSGGNMLISSLSASKPMIFVTGGSRTERMRITAGGLIGLGGVSSPGALLDVLQPTLGNAVQKLASTATNDDPTEIVYQNRVATTDATITTLHTFTVPSTTTYFITGQVVARRTGGSAGTAEDGAVYTFQANYKNVAGTATLIGPGGGVTALSESQAGWDCVLSLSGATVLLRVTGATNNNVTFHMSARVYQVST